MAKSFLEDEIGGLYTPGLRFAFTNISTEDFTSYWAKIPIIVKAGETIEVSDGTPIPGTNMGQNLAIKMTGELVDRIMQGEAKMDEVSFYKNNPGVAPQSYHSSKGVSAGIPAARKPFEDQILRRLDDSDSPMQGLQAQVMAEIRAGEENMGEQVGLPNSAEEFVDLKARTKEVEPKKAIRTKKIA